jgi:hypothetical protein
MDNEITCPHCKNTISNSSVIDSAGKDAGLVSTFVFCECGEKITFGELITQVRGQKNLPPESKMDFINLPWMEPSTELP